MWPWPFHIDQRKVSWIVHYSAIWTTSPARIELMTNRSEDTWLIGDSGYPLEPWLLIPVTSVTPSTREKKYNELHKKSRNVIERAFGVLKSRFKCLSRTRTLYYSHERAANILYCCVIFHNMLTKRRLYLDPEMEEMDETNDIPRTLKLEKLLEMELK